MQMICQVSGTDGPAMRLAVRYRDSLATSHATASLFRMSGYRNLPQQTIHQN